MNKFENDIQRSLKVFSESNDCLYVKIPDTHKTRVTFLKAINLIRGIADDCKTHKLDKQIMILYKMLNITQQRVISDFVLHLKDKVVYIECKETKQTRFPFSNIKPHQLAFGDTLETLGTHYLFFIRFNSVKYKPMFVVSATKLKEYIDETDKKSINIRTFNEQFMRVEMHKGVYDLSFINDI